MRIFPALITLPSTETPSSITMSLTLFTLPQIRAPERMCSLPRITMLLRDDLAGLNLEVTVVQETLSRRRAWSCGGARVWRGCIPANGCASDLNAGSVQPQKTALGLQTNK